MEIIDKIKSALPKKFRVRDCCHFGDKCEWRIAIDSGVFPRIRDYSLTKWENRKRKYQLRSFRTGGGVISYKTIDEAILEIERDEKR